MGEMQFLGFRARFLRSLSGVRAECFSALPQRPKPSAISPRTAKKGR
jgi:hypothetical protein